MPNPTAASNPFRLGLVMAGAVSAGAYTAGVLDFLFEALAEWEKEKASGRSDIPDHQVVIEAMSGASAGGICSAFSAMLPTLGFFPVHSPTDPACGQNLLYQSWVKGIDLTKMLTTNDLKGVVPSLLDGGALDTVANNAVNRTVAAASLGTGSWPNWLADGLPLYLCLTNTPGVPYLLSMTTGNQSVRGHRVVVHTDMAPFWAGTKPVATDQGYLLPLNSTDKSVWQRLADASLATAAFPVGLPARLFTQDSKIYDSTMWRSYNGLEPQDPTTQKLSPDWDTHVGASYSFYALDGGAINNEPLELVRRYLARNSNDGRNPRPADQADAALLMIDPFPDDAEHEVQNYGEVFDVIDSFTNLLGNLKAQGRFNSQDFVLAMSDQVFSRFLIAPIRTKSDPKESHLASSGVSGFAGFFHEALREHDFFLGRRNCQRFLENYLCVSRDNPIVAGWVKTLAAKGKLEDYHPLSYDPITQKTTLNKSYVRLIPLFGACNPQLNPAYNPPYPRLDYERDVRGRLQALVTARANAVVKASHSYLSQKLGVGSFWLKLPLSLLGVGNKLASKMMTAIEQDLRDRKILR